MSEQLSTSVLRRMLAQDQPAAVDVPLTVARALRLSLARAAEKHIGLRLTVQDVSEEVLTLDGLLERLSNDLLLLQLHREGAQVGIAALDTGLVSAVVEAQTMGRLAERSPEARPMTSVDASLAEIYLAGLLSEMADTVQSTNMDDWITDVSQQGQYRDLRQIGMALPQQSYRLLVMKIDFGVADRTGTFLFTLPLARTAQTQPVETRDKPDWATTFPETVGAAKAELPVILHRYNLTLAKVQQMAVGEVLTLPGCRVDAVRLEGPNGALLARGRLGQMGGYLALRLTEPESDMLQDLSGGQIAAAPMIDDAPPLPPPGDAFGLPEPDSGAAIDMELAQMNLGPLVDEVEDTTMLGGDTMVEDAAEVDLGGLGDMAGDDLDLADKTTEDASEIDLGSIDLSSLGTE